MTKKKTIPDIVREMRTHERGSAADAWYTPKTWRQLCDSLEEAHKRELATAENSSAVGNTGKLREALESMLEIDASEEAAMADGLTDAERMFEYADHIVECQKKAKAVLAEPPRNCDHYKTPEEAEKAYWALCNAYYNDACEGCPFQKHSPLCITQFLYAEYKPEGEK